MSQTYDYDVVFIGAGHGAFDGAPALTAAGKKVAFIEEDRVGGTCPNWGCNAKIILEAPTKLLTESMQSQGIIHGAHSLDWKKAMERKQAIIDGFAPAIQKGMEMAGIHFIFGHASFKDAHTVQVADKTYTADKFVIATGQHSHRLDIPGKEFLHDSKDFLSIPEVPERMVIIGAGFIGLEAASIMQTAGAKVTVILRDQQALPAFDREYSDQLCKALTKQGVLFLKNTEVQKVEQNGSSYSIETTTGSLPANYILDATGRIPNTQDLNLDQIGVEYDHKGIIVNDFLQTKQPNIYATGDVLKKDVPKLTPTATFESQYVVAHILGEDKEPINYPAIAQTVFTMPRLAQAGVTIKEAKANPDQYDMIEQDTLDDWYRSVDFETPGQRTLIYNKTKQLVGVIELSDKAEDVVNALLPAIEFGYTKAQLKRLVTIFPSIGYSALDNLG
ncbi:NAD(P)/FAD-dependent oxidoreductase [Fructobacillus sp. M1-13]|uniref:NAD(P)/FAD-dependent oxidoreductase n=1 Tax=Fructobacillus papyriferae TaxID=2713171 RepID=A0ABS5QSF9_9LACO|nr:NAD(P)/FAD-dependent oxidoreductase [Fructobacillus papyriferae]MBS9335249.1 NAD(P)/FAD-dependent oxidoreductase [Fructobacillus papyriferae]MCD2159082.1 NAD(P)/FAD-dependent oxidoreductase [Fructobacillus papyriferae]